MIPSSGEKFSAVIWTGDGYARMQCLRCDTLYRRPLIAGEEPFPGNFQCAKCDRIRQRKGGKP